MNALQQFIQSKLSTAVRPDQSIGGSPQVSEPQPGLLERFRGAGQNIAQGVGDIAQRAGSAALGAGQAIGRGAGDLLLKADRYNPNSADYNPGSPLMQQHPEDMQRAMGMAMGAEGGMGAELPKAIQPAVKAAKEVRVALIDHAGIHHLAQMLEKNTPFGYINRGELMRDIYDHINPKVNFPPNQQRATFGELYRGIAKHLGVDPDDVPNPDFIKALAKAYNEIFSGEHIQQQGGNAANPFK